MLKHYQPISWVLGVLGEIYKKRKFLKGRGYTVIDKKLRVAFLFFVHSPRSSLLPT